MVPHTHPRSRPGSGSRRRHEQERALDLLAKQAGVVEAGHSALANVDAPPPRWAKELAARLEAENEAYRQTAVCGRAAGYIPPIRLPWTLTSSILQRERDRLAKHLMDTAQVRTRRQNHVREVAAAERGKVGRSRFEPIPSHRLGVMLRAVHSAEHVYPDPPKPRILPLGPHDRRHLDTVGWDLVQALSLASDRAAP